FTSLRLNPMSRGTTQTGRGNAEFFSVAVGVELVSHALASDTWNRSAAPVSQYVPGAPTSTVVASADAPSPGPPRTVLPPKKSLVVPAELVSVAAGAEIDVHAFSPEARKTYDAPLSLCAPGAVATTVV